MESIIASDPTLIRKAWIWMLGWYKKSFDRHPPPSRVALATMTVEREELYWNAPLMREPILV